MVENVNSVARESGKEAPGKKARVLVADDSKLVRKTATRILGENFDLVLAVDGEDAWQKLCGDSSIRVVFTDLGMPNLDGYGLIQRIRQADDEGVRALPIIVITGAAEEESVRKKVFEIGATDFITKPFKSTEIIARAEAHASYHQDKAELQQSVNVDLLTGTLNRKGLDEKLEKDISFINRHRQSLALVIFELDNFKTIAERAKQQNAEKIIQSVAKVLSSAIRKEDSFGRYEFAKFVTILPMAKTEGVVQLAKRLCEHIKSFKINVAGEPLELSLSVGIAAVVKGRQATPEGLMKTAEQALDNARAVGPGEVQLLKAEGKQGGRKTVEVSIDNLLDTIAREDGEVTADELKVALERLSPLVRLLSDDQKRRLIQQ